MFHLVVILTIPFLEKSMIQLCCKYYDSFYTRKELLRCEVLVVVFLRLGFGLTCCNVIKVKGSSTLDFHFSDSVQLILNQVLKLNNPAVLYFSKGDFPNRIICESELLLSIEAIRIEEMIALGSKKSATFMPWGIFLRTQVPSLNHQNLQGYALQTNLQSRVFLCCSFFSENNSTIAFTLKPKLARTTQITQASMIPCFIFLVIFPLFTYFFSFSTLFLLFILFFLGGGAVCWNLSSETENPRNIFSLRDSKSVQKASIINKHIYFIHCPLKGVFLSLQAMFVWYNCVAFLNYSSFKIPGENVQPQVRNKPPQPITQKTKGPSCSLLIIDLSCSSVLLLLSSSPHWLVLKPPLLLTCFFPPLISSFFSVVYHKALVNSLKSGLVLQDLPLTKTLFLSSQSVELFEPRHTPVLSPIGLKIGFFLNILGHQPKTIRAGLQKSSIPPGNSVGNRTWKREKLTCSLPNIVSFFHSRDTELNKTLSPSGGCHECKSTCCIVPSTTGSELRERCCMWSESLGDCLKNWQGHLFIPIFHHFTLQYPQFPLVHITSLKYPLHFDTNPKFPVFIFCHLRKSKPVLLLLFAFDWIPLPAWCGVFIGEALRQIKENKGKYLQDFCLAERVEFCFLKPKSTQHTLGKDSKLPTELVFLSTMGWKKGLKWIEMVWKFGLRGIYMDIPSATKRENKEGSAIRGHSKRKSLNCLQLTSSMLQPSKRNSLNRLQLTCSIHVCMYMFWYSCCAVCKVNVHQSFLGSLWEKVEQVVFCSARFLEEIGPENHWFL
ncbi:putative signal peptide protein [Puccinia sorghi]|uniref:Putative signal peptide protein n=1 Tax=Puccinia sorghi TaxID=27349 RepID=A0A0L6UFL8_9BASI|nr:putative signal peptide protein [Puccinia sorghi]